MKLPLNSSEIYIDRVQKHFTADGNVTFLQLFCCFWDFKNKRTNMLKVDLLLKCISNAGK